MLSIEKWLDEGARGPLPTLSGAVRRDAVIGVSAVVVDDCRYRYDRLRFDLVNGKPRYAEGSMGVENKRLAHRVIAALWPVQEESER